MMRVVRPVSSGHMNVSHRSQGTRSLGNRAATPSIPGYEREAAGAFFSAIETSPVKPICDHNHDSTEEGPAGESGNAYCATRIARILAIFKPLDQNFSTFGGVRRAFL